MAKFVPLSRRDDPSWHEPAEGIPEYLLAPLWAWIGRFLMVPYGGVDESRLLEVQAVLRLAPPLKWSSAGSALGDLQNRIFGGDQELGLDVIDYLLQQSTDERDHADLEEILIRGGSVWQVRRKDDWTARLTRRVLEPTAEAIAMIRSDSERAHSHLRASWSELVGRHPNPSTAYREAVRAVEAAAKPIVSPADGRATLGRMIGEMGAKPAKWHFVVNEGDITPVVSMCKAIWSSQLDRHGTDDDSVPLSVSQEQADAAFHTALALVRMFTGGLVSRAS
ncbi:MAG: hypothetical protein KDC36_10025 [Thermoleophilia bacterium]|nr:hypothetical protein [Thermoleophilia bacterium]